MTKRLGVLVLVLALTLAVATSCGDDEPGMMTAPSPDANSDAGDNSGDDGGGGDNNDGGDNADDPDGDDNNANGNNGAPLAFTCEVSSEDSPIITPIWQAGGAGDRDELGKFGKPDALFLNAHGILIAGDESGDFEELHLFDTRTEDPDREAEFITPLVDYGASPGPGGSGELEFRGISGFAEDPDSGLLYVVEQGNGRVQVLRPAADPTEAPYYTFERFQGGFAPDKDNPADGEFVRLQAARTDRLGRLFVSDDARGNDERARRDVQIFDRDGGYLGKFGDGSYGDTVGEDGNLQEPENFVIDELRDRIYVCDEGPGEVAVYRYSDLAYLERIEGFVGTPNGVDIDQYGYLYVVDEGNNDTSNIRVFEPDGLEEVFRFGAYSESFDLTPGMFNSPDTLIIDIAQDVLLLADQGHKRIQAFRLSEIQQRACIRSLRLTGPPKAVAESEVSVRVELLGPVDGVDWASFKQEVAVSVVSGGAGVPGAPETTPLYNGAGVVTFVVPASATDLTVTISAGGARAAHALEVVDPGVARAVTGTLEGDDLVWGDGEVIALEGEVTVPEGSTLTIAAGAVVVLGGEARMLISGDIEAIGTEDKPITFSAGSPDAQWGQIDHGGGEAVYHNVFFTGGANAFWERNDEFRHCCAYILRKREGTIDLDRVVMTASDGKALLAFDADVTIRRSLFMRLGHGGEFPGSDVEVSSSRYATFRGPDDNDAIYFSNQPNPGTFQVRRCVFAEADDDGIDTENASFHGEDVIIYGIADKAMTLTGGSSTCTNCLAIDNKIAVKIDDKFRDAPSEPSFDRVTFTDNAQHGYLESIRDGLDAEADIRATFESSIIWGNPVSIATEFDDPSKIVVRECIVEDLLETVTAEDNIDGPPIFVAPSRQDYRLHPFSPGYGSVGWDGW